MPIIVHCVCKLKLSIFSNSSKELILAPGSLDDAPLKPHEPRIPIKNTPATSSNDKEV